MGLASATIPESLPESGKDCTLRPSAYDGRFLFPDLITGGLDKMNVADAIVIGLMLGTVLALAWAVAVSWVELRKMRSSK